MNLVGVFFGHLIIPIISRSSLMSRVMIAKGNGHISLSIQFCRHSIDIYILHPYYTERMWALFLDGIKVGIV